MGNPLLFWHAVRTSKAQAPVADSESRHELNEKLDSDGDLLAAIRRSVGASALSRIRRGLRKPGRTKAIAIEQLAGISAAGWDQPPQSS
jgi:hypothetical protein